jgi:electron transfer flavoprotein alpha/beta subunit
MKVRKPNVKGIMQAKKAKVDVHSADVPASTIRNSGIPQHATSKTCR